MIGLFRPGQLLLGNQLEIIDKVGAGGFSEVYRAIWNHKNERRIVAVKCFNTDGMKQDDFRSIQQIHKESLIIASIGDESALRIYAMETGDIVPYLIEEYLEGGDCAHYVSDRVKERKTEQEPLFSTGEILDFAIKLMTSLTSVHSKSIYHGDIKPSNICFRDLAKQEPVLVDYGHGEFYESNLFGSNSSFVSLVYLPPERTGFVKLGGSASSDLYSLGITLYEMCHGLPPFLVRDEKEFLNRLLFEVPKPLYAHYRSIPEQFSDIIQKLLRKNPDERYHSAFGFLSDLKRCQEEFQRDGHISSFALGTKDKLRELNYKIPIVGRKLERDFLSKAIDPHNLHKPLAYFIGAPSGYGKSRFVHEFLLEAREAGYKVTSVKFSELEKSLPLSAMSILLMDFAESLRNSSKGRQDIWKNHVLKHVGDKGELVKKRFPFFADLLPDYGTRNSGEVVEMQDEVVAFNEALALLLAHLSLNQNQILFLDDLQWADEQSLAVLREICFLVEKEPQLKTLLIGTFRSNEIDENHPLRSKVLNEIRDNQLIQLGPLSRAESNELIEHLLDESGPEIARLQDVCYQLTEGNPFFIYEYLKSAIDSNIFEMDAEKRTWAFNEANSRNNNLSQGVATLVADRLQKLDSLVKEVVMAASVVGASISFEALAAILADGTRHADGPVIDPPRIAQAYEELLQKRFVQNSGKRFVFFHDKICEATYRMLSPEKRRLYHTAYGQWLSKRLIAESGKNASKELFECAFHLQEGCTDRFTTEARIIFHRAALAAIEVYAYGNARGYLEKCSTLFPKDFENDRDLRAEWVDVHECWGNTLAISDQIKDSLELYDKVLAYVDDPLRRAEIYAKKVEYNLALFHYKASMEAGVLGLKSLNEKIITEEWVAYLYILTMLPVLLMYVFYFSLFGKQTKVLKSKREKIRFHLLLNLEIPFYFAKPIVAIANIIPTTLELLSYKDNDFRAIAMCYWGICLSPFGFNKTANQCFSRAFTYFEQQNNPILKGFVLFTWGYSLDFLLGNFKSSHYKLTEAIKTLTPVGESFWRSLSYVGLLHINYFGMDSADGNHVSSSLIDLWKRIQYLPTVIGCAMRNFLHEKRDDQIDIVLDITKGAEEELREQGFNSVDMVFARLSPGELHFIRGEYAQAEVHLREAFIPTVLHFHRIAYSVYSPVIYAWALIRQRKLLKAIPPLAFAWFNQLLRAHAFLPQTYFVSGEFAWEIGFPMLGRRLINAGIKVASRRRSRTVMADGRLVLGRLLLATGPEEAEIFLRLAKDQYATRGWIYFEELCDRLIAKAKMHGEESVAVQARGFQNSKTSFIASQVRQKIETDAMLQIFLKLSSLGKETELLTAAVDSLCLLTGAESGLIFLNRNDTWQPVLGKNLLAEEVLKHGYLKFNIDKKFLDYCTESEMARPSIRKQGWQKAGELGRGSVMVVPLHYNDSTLGYCYLANSQIYDLFDDRSIDAVMPVATQTSITMQSIYSTESLRIQNEAIQELNATLEARVEAQTRDIRSIMEHVPIGIFTVMGPSAIIHKDYSRHLEELFEVKDLQDRPALPLLLDRSDISGDELAQVRNAFSIIMAEILLNFQLNEHLLPRKIVRTNQRNSLQYLELSWMPIENDQMIVDKILVAVMDVTEIRKLEDIAQRNANELQIVGEILSIDASVFDQFIHSATELNGHSQMLVETSAPTAAKRADLETVAMNMHSLKGSARGLGLKGLSEAYHQLEGVFFELTAHPDHWNAEVFLSAFELVTRKLQVYREVAQHKLGRSDGKNGAHAVEMERAYEVYESIRNANRISDLQGTLDSLRALLHTPFGEFLESFKLSLESIAQELGKARPMLVLSGIQGVFLQKRHEQSLRNIINHIVRNSIDHGIERPESRRARGKIPAGRITMAVHPDGLNLRINIRDDGGGLNLLGLRKKFRLDHPDRLIDKAAIHEIIFTPGFSTADEVSEVSGRGIGMAAVARMIQTLGGDIWLDIPEGDLNGLDFISFSMNIDLPQSMFDLRSGRTSSLPSAS